MIEWLVMTDGNGGHSLMSALEVAAEYEAGANWQDWQDADERDVLQMRLVALRHREAMLEREAAKLHQEGDLLSELLMVI
jgi:cell division protein FtsB